jgi:hypothetical protein
MSSPMVPNPTQPSSSYVLARERLLDHSPEGVADERAARSWVLEFRQRWVRATFGSACV